MTQLTSYEGFVNSPATTLSAGITDSDVTIPVTDVSVFPATGANTATIGTGEDAETVLYQYKSASSGAGNLCVVTREFNKIGSFGAKKAWDSGTVISRQFTEYDLRAATMNIADLVASLADKEPTITTLTVNKGGTGAGTLTGLLVGDGTNAIAGGHVATVAQGGTALTALPVRTLFLSCAGGWTGTTLPDGGFSTTEGATDKLNYKGTLFAAAAATANHEFGVMMPYNWDLGAIAASPCFVAATGTETGSPTIIFNMQAVAISSGDDMDAAYAATVTSTYTISTTIWNKMILGPSVSFTPGGTPAKKDLVMIRTGRAGEDTFSGSVVLVGWLLSYGVTSHSDV